MLGGQGAAGLPQADLSGYQPGVGMANVGVGRQVPNDIGMYRDQIQQQVDAQGGRGVRGQERERMEQIAMQELMRMQQQQEQQRRITQNFDPLMTGRQGVHQPHMQPSYLQNPDQFNKGNMAPVPYDKMLQEPDVVADLMEEGAMPDDDDDYGDEEDEDGVGRIPAEIAIENGQRIAMALRPYRSIYAGVPEDPLVNIAEIDRRKRRTRSIYGLIF